MQTQYRFADLPWRHCFTVGCGITHTWATDRDGQLSVMAGKVEVPGTSYDTHFAKKVMAFSVEERQRLAIGADLGATPEMLQSVLLPTPTLPVT